MGKYRENKNNHNKFNNKGKLTYYLINQQSCMHVMSGCCHILFSSLRCILFLNETFNKVRICKHFSDSFPIQNGLKQGDALSPLLFNFALEYAVMWD
jgi:hypothetical protein